MILSHRHRFIFFAVPRTATHAIRNALQPILGDDDWQQEALRLQVRSPLPQLARIGHGHVTVREAQAALPGDVWRRYFKFAVVRDPFDRYVSVCAMLNKRNPDYAGKETVFMKRALRAPRFRQRVLVRPQASMLAGEDGEFGLDYIGRYESLQSSFAAICQRIDIVAPTLAISNASARRSRDAYYDDELRRLVVDFYHRDFALFGYPTVLSCA